jgi:hypothetical protein
LAHIVSLIEVQDVVTYEVLENNPLQLKEWVRGDGQLSTRMILNVGLTDFAQVACAVLYSLTKSSIEGSEAG